MDTPPPHPRRGQLYLDIIVGVGVFVLAIAFVLSFAPGLFTSFADDPSRPLVTDRTADRLSGPILGTDTRPSGLNETCTSAFLTQSGSVCEIDTDRSLTSQVGIRPIYRLNVSLARPQADAHTRATLCLDGGTIVSCAPGLDRATVGPPTPAHRTSTTTTLRTVHVSGRDATLVVRVW